MGDGAQQRGLQLVGAAQRLGLDHLRLHPLALALERRQLGQRPVGLLAAALGLGGPGAGEVGEGAAGEGDDDEDDEGDQVVVGADVEGPSGGRWKKLKASALTTAVASPSRSPQTIEISRTPGM